MKEFSHLNAEHEPQMVDVTEKRITQRLAEASVDVIFPPEVWNALQENQWQTAKGSIVHTATIAGMMAAKKTAELIPMCHPLALTGIDFRSEFIANGIRLFCTVKCEGKTGVEMEALTGCSLAALTVYDMCKALSHDIVISEIKLVEKKGGKHDFERKSGV